MVEQTHATPINVSGLRLFLFVTPVAVLLNGRTDVRAADWVQWAGNDRQGNWTETGILKEFPKDGLNFKWRTPIGSGYAGPVVWEGKVYAL
ncbi:MAG: hypothetical protein IIB72_04160, partial [Proteobacteria bacterium]|nr:hypothetical protein [Pseudomonadota bacterium]